MTDSTTSPALDNDNALNELKNQLTSTSEKTQLQAIAQLSEAGEAGLELLQGFLLERRQAEPTVASGKAYQVLYNAEVSSTREFLQSHFPDGLIPLDGDGAIAFRDVQTHLAALEFQEADRLTVQTLCQLAGDAAQERKWLYFTEVDRIPSDALQTLDRLWRIYSEGKFGFSVQREIWLGVGKNWDKMWPKIGWKEGNHWTRYPNGFTWDLSAPKGHLPLSNQLRGVRVIERLLSHPAWE
ncbi:MAG: GUN4 domain-containing protein [Cyanobacteria bacterium J007]|jgi:hypothetical protein|nr:MAG: GUN4 domain-containing protein [Cyanobacteria bacterium J007]